MASFLDTFFVFFFIAKETGITEMKFARFENKMWGVVPWYLFISSKKGIRKMKCVRLSPFLVKQDIKGIKCARPF